MITYFVHLLTLKTNISPLSMVTVSKFPSQMSGAWLSGTFGGRGGAGGRGGGRGGGAGGTSFLMGGVTGSGSEAAVVVVGEGGVEVGPGLGSGRSGGSKVSPVGFGASGGGLGWEDGVGSAPGGKEVGGSSLGLCSGVWGAVGGAAVTRGGPWKTNI